MITKIKVTGPDHDGPRTTHIKIDQHIDDGPTVTFGTKPPVAQVIVELSYTDAGRVLYLFDNVDEARGFFYAQVMNTVLGFALPDEGLGKAGEEDVARMHRTEVSKALKEMCMEYQGTTIEFSELL